MVAALKKPGQPRNIRRVDSKLIESFQATTLSDYVTKSSENLFSSLKIDSTFLDSDPSTRSSRQDYVSCREIVCALRVVNDCAERAAKLVTDFNASLTLNEEQKQLMFQVVE